MTARKPYCVFPHALPFALTALAFSIQGHAQNALEEIVVTAEKRESSLQDTPLAVSAFSQDTLDKALIFNAMDMQFSVPNMLMSKGNFTGATISLRGIGQTAVGSSADAPVGIHMNGVYLNAPRIFETGFLDVERVEVLRGPQGTTYGRNTSGGVINMITAKPEMDAISGLAEGSFGSYGEMEARAHINIPLGDSLAMRVGGYSFKRDGFVKDENLGKDVDDRDMYMGRISLRMTPNDAIDVNLMAQFFREDDSRVRSQKQACNKDTGFSAITGQYGVTSCAPVGPGDKLGFGTLNGAGTVSGFLTTALNGSFAPLFAGFGSSGFPVDDYAQTKNPQDIRSVSTDWEPRYISEEDIVTLDASFDLTDELTLYSLTGYQESLIWSSEDYTKAVPSESWMEPLNTIALASNLGLLPYGALEYNKGVPLYTTPDGVNTTDPFRVQGAFNMDVSTTSAEQWSEEIRLQSSYDGSWNFMAGGFWLSYQAENHYTIYDAALSLYGQIAGLPINQQLYDNHTRDFQLDTWAAFGELYWTPTDDMTVTFGLRYTDEEKYSQQRTIYLASFANPNAPDGDWAYFKNDAQETTGRLNIAWNASDDLLVFGQLSTSFTSGGFNPLQPNNPALDPAQGGDPSLATFEPAFIDAIEVGFKSTLLNGTMFLNGTAFYYDYKDRQTSKIVNQTSLNLNVDGSVYGFEGELNWAATDELMITAQLSLLETEIDEFSDYDTSNISGDYSTAFLFDCLGDNYLFTPTGAAPVGQCAVLAGSGLDTIPGSTGVVQNLTGNEYPGSPSASFNIGVSYTFGLTDMDLIVSTNYYWQDSYYVRIFNDPVDQVEEWDVWNGSARLQSRNDSWYVEAWIKNILDEDYVTGSYLTDMTSGSFRNLFLLDPQTAGVTLGIRF